MSKLSEDAGRRTYRSRVDAERNRLRLVEVAKSAFAREGAMASLEQVARDAGVGIGTLYRHFPTRDALIEAVYRQEIDTLIGAAMTLAAERTPMEALRSWLLLFVDFFDTKMGIAGVLGTLSGGPDRLYDSTPARLDAAARMLVERAQVAGDMSVTIEPMDFVRALAGVASVHPGARWHDAAKQMVDILLAGASATRR